MAVELFGSYGGPGGVSWNDGQTHTGVCKIALSYKLGAGIGSFTTYYTEDPAKGYPHPSGPSGDDTYIRVNIPLNTGEFITKVRGYIGIVPGAATKTEVIRSLTIETNENTYTYGPQEGRAFSSPLITYDSHVSGFVGRTSNDFLDAIGFYVKAN